MFQDTRKPLRLWFRAMWYVTNQKHGVSVLSLKGTLGLGSYRTAWTWLRKLRQAMVRPGRDRLSGIVEVDEAYLGGEKPGKRGRGAAGKSLVVVAAQEDGHGIGRVRGIQQSYKTGMGAGFPFPPTRKLGFGGFCSSQRRHPTSS